LREDALFSGCAVNGDGQSEASMGVVAGDVDGDGDEDLFMTHLELQTNTLYLNDGRGLFHDRTDECGLGAPSWSFTGFGAVLLDVDNDGRLDLLTVNGAVGVLEDLLRAGDPFPFHQTNQLFRNLGDGRFAEITAEAGEVFGLSEVSRGAAAGDVDDDGDTDVVVTAIEGPVRLLVNQVAQERHWLGLRLLDRSVDRDVLGARVVLLREGSPPLVRRVRTDGSYASASDPRVLFGLDRDAATGRVEVTWPGGPTEVWENLPADRYSTLRQGSGLRRAP